MVYTAYLAIRRAWPGDIHSRPRASRAASCGFAVLSERKLVLALFVSLRLERDQRQIKQGGERASR